MKISIFDKRTNLEKEIDRVLLDMSLLPKDSREYSAILDNLEKLYKAKGLDGAKKSIAKGLEKLPRISLDTIAVVLGNLLGIALILGYEKENVITTKALGFILKGRV